MHGARVQGIQAKVEVVVFMSYILVKLDGSIGFSHGQTSFRVKGILVIVRSVY